MIAFLALPTAATVAGTSPATLAVFDGTVFLGRVREVEAFVWWWQAPGMPHFAPADGPHQRDAVLALLAARDRDPAGTPPPRRGIPTSDRLLRACRESGKGDRDAEG